MTNVSANPKASRDGLDMVGLLAFRCHAVCGYLTKICDQPEIVCECLEDLCRY